MANYTHEILRMIEKVYTGTLSTSRKELVPEGFTKGLSPQEVHIVLCLGKSGQLSVSSLCNELQIERGLLTTVMQRLIKRRVLVKEKDKSDQRVTLVGLTRLGERYFHVYNEKLSDIIGFILSDITLNEEKAILKFLGRVNTLFVDPVDID